MDDVHQVGSVAVGERVDTEDDVSKQFHMHIAEAEHDERTKHGVSGHSNNRLHAGTDHGLHRDGGHLRTPSETLEPIGDLLDIPYVQHHTTHLELVGDTRRDVSIADRMGESNGRRFGKRI